MTNNVAQSKKRCFFEMLQEESLQQHSFWQDDCIRNAETFQQVKISVTLLKTTPVKILTGRTLLGNFSLLTEQTGS